MTPTHTPPRARRAAACLMCLCALALAAAPARAQGREEFEVKTSPSPGAAATPEPPARSSVYGRAVYEDTGRPVRRGRVMILNLNGEGQERSGLTDARGEFQIKNLPAGRYVVAVDLAGLLSPVSFINLEEVKEPSRPSLEGLREHFQYFELDGKADKELSVRARRGAAVSGRVRYADGDPAVNAAVRLLRVRDGKAAAFLTGFGQSTILGLRTDDRGAYRIAGVPPGEYYVGVSEIISHAEGGDYEEMPGGIGATSPFASTFHPSATHPSKATVVRVEEKGEVEDVDITIPERAGRTVAGVVRERGEGRPVTFATLMLSSKEAGPSTATFLPGGASQTVTSDEHGRWRFRELPDGDYTIAVVPRPTDGAETTSAEEGAGRARRRSPWRKLAARAFDLKVSGSDVGDVVIELAQGARVSGTYVFEDGKEPEGYLSFFVEAVGANSERLGPTGGPSFNGQFSVEGVPAGRAFLRHQIYGRGEGATGLYYMKSLTWQGRDLLREPLEVAEGAQIEGVRAVLASDMATLQLRALAARDKRPVGGVRVFLLLADAPQWLRAYSDASCLTGPDGACALTARPGDFLVVARPPGSGAGRLSEADIRAYAPSATRLTLQPNERRSMEVVVPETK